MLFNLYERDTDTRVKGEIIKQLVKLKQKNCSKQSFITWEYQTKGFIFVGWRKEKRRVVVL